MSKSLAESQDQCQMQFMELCNYFNIHKGSIRGHVLQNIYINDLPFICNVRLHLSVKFFSFIMAPY